MKNKMMPFWFREDAGEAVVHADVRVIAPAIVLVTVLVTVPVTVRVIAPVIVPAIVLVAVFFALAFSYAAVVPVAVDSRFLMETVTA